MSEATDWVALAAAATTATTTGHMTWVGADNAVTLRWQSLHAALVLTHTDSTYTLAVVNPDSHHELGSTTDADTSGLDTLWTAAQAAASHWPSALTNVVAAVQGLAT